MLGLVRDRVRGELGFDERRCIDRLLVAQARSSFALASPVMAGEAERSDRETALVSEPAQRLHAWP